MRVLVVSESADERQRVVSALARDGVEIVEATTGKEAHALTGHGDFDVIVMDGDLCPEGGYSILYELRQRDEYEGQPSTPAIILMERRDDGWLANWAGAQLALLKPVDPFAIADHVLDLARASGPAPV